MNEGGGGTIPKYQHPPFFKGYCNGAELSERGHHYYQSLSLFLVVHLVPDLISMTVFSRKRWKKTGFRPGNRNLVRNPSRSHSPSTHPQPFFLPPLPPCNDWNLVNWSEFWPFPSNQLSFFPFLPLKFAFPLQPSPSPFTGKKGRNRSFCMFGRRRWQRHGKC